MLEHLTEGTSQKTVTLDDLSERKLAKTDRGCFWRCIPPPVLIDEIQYAPELFSNIKIAIDKGAPAGSYWLIGSQAFRLMDLAQESLAGRAAILHMSALSQSEMYSGKATTPFTVDLAELIKRKDGLTSATATEMYERI